MNDYVVIIYNGEQVSVPKEVADFLEQDRKRQQAQDKQDARHLSKSEFETVPSGSDCVRRPVEDAALRNLQLENLRKAIAELDVQGHNLLSLRYSDALTMDEIGQIYGISKMAVFPVSSANSIMACSFALTFNLPLSSRMMRSTKSCAG